MMNGSGLFEPRRVERARAVAGAIRRAVPLTDSMEALELGCGTGLLTTDLAPHFRRVIAVDTSERMLAVLRSKIEALGLSDSTSRPAPPSTKG